MVAYRFCRSDDVPFLVKALNECYFVHFPDSSGTSVDDFKRDIRELGLWTSSCMVGSVDGEPIALATGAKRTGETLIHRIGVRPDFLRLGHARHLLSSLSQKFAVLGPPRIVAEVPTDRPGACALFEACGFHRRGELADYSRVSSPTGSHPLPVDLPQEIEDVAIPITLDEVLEQGVFDREISRSWERSLETLESRRDQIQGVAIAGEESIEAYALYQDPGPHSPRVVLAVANADTEESATRLEILLRFMSTATPMGVTIPKVSIEEVSPALLLRAGLQKEREYVVWEAAAGQLDPG